MAEARIALNYIESQRVIIIDDEFDIRSITHKIRLMAKQGVNLFLIDYLQLAMKDPASVKEVEEITRDLKRLAMSLNVLIILVAQFHRKDDIKMYKDVVVKRKPLLSDLKGGSAIECNSDKVMFLHYDPEWSGNYLASSYVEFMMAKNRQGPGAFSGIYLMLDKMKCFFQQTEWRPPQKER
jgi:replicative DNA helicase